MTLNTALTQLIRLRDNKITCTGGVVFIGDGNTGKTHTAMNLTSYRGKHFYNFENDSIRKSLNLELDYFIFQSHVEEYNLTTSSQIFIMPGQKGRAEVGEGLAFEDAVDLFIQTSSINVVVALVLTFDLTDVKTFQELEYWLNRAIERDIIREYTSIILLGTHLDLVQTEQISDEQFEASRSFIRDVILDKQGLEIDINNIFTAKVSNTSLKGIEKFKEIINTAFMRAFRIDDIIKQLSSL